MKLQKLANCVLVVLALGATACSTAPTRDSQAEVREFVVRFIRAVNESSVDDFVASFAPNATAFFPSPENAMRRVGRDAIRDAVTPSFKQGPPSQPVVPRELTISVDGGTAYVTFDAGSGVLHSRRTLILRRFDDAWLISHLHASNVSER